MRVVVVIFAALLTLGLAAFGVVAAQKSSGSGSLIALAEHIMSPAQATSAPAAAGAQASQTQVAQASPVQAPVIKVSETTGHERRPAAAPAKLVVAQNSARGRTRSSAGADA